MDHLSLQTSRTLLLRVRDPADQEGWRLFVSRYGPYVLRWIRSETMSQHDAEEVCQRVMVKLVQQMRQFEYDRQRGSFRGWLRTVTLNTWRDFLRENKRFQSRLDALDPDQLSDDFAYERERELLELALLHVQRKTSAQAWQAFYLRALENLSAKETAQQLEMTVAAVNMHKSRVQALVKEEFVRLQQEN